MKNTTKYQLVNDVLNDLEQSLNANSALEYNEERVISIITEFQNIIQKRIMNDIRGRIRKIAAPLVAEFVSEKQVELIKSLTVEKQKAENISKAREITNEIINNKVEEKVKIIRKQIELEFSVGTVKRLRETIAIQNAELKRLGSNLAS